MRQETDPGKLSDDFVRRNTMIHPMKVWNLQKILDFLCMMQKIKTIFRHEVE